jgi:hypothetical protein
VTWAATIDRGPAWGRTVHHLSEMLLLGSDSTDSAEHYVLLLSTTYQDITGFSVRGLHHGGAQAAVRRLLIRRTVRTGGSMSARRASLWSRRAAIRQVRTT